MRSLKNVVLLLGLFPFLAAGTCGGEKDDPVCGNGRCEKNDGETNYACPEDCPPVCGDGWCDEMNNESCRLDCEEDEPDQPDQPRTFMCGGQTGTCSNLDHYAACCYGVFWECTSPYYAYFCPADGLCYDQPCPSTYQCTYFAMSCKQ